MTQNDLIALSFFEEVCFRNEIIRIQLRRLNIKERIKLIETTDLSTKWERYAYTRLINLPNGEKMPIKRLIDEIELTYGFTLNQYHKNRLYKVRTKVYNQRRKRKNVCK